MVNSSRNSRACGFERFNTELLLEMELSFILSATLTGASNKDIFHRSRR